MFSLKSSVPAYVISLLLSPAIFATNSAQHYPMPVSKYVNDYIGLLQPQENRMIADKLHAYQQHTGIECTIVIIDSINSYASGMTLETFATNLFNKWGIGNCSKNNGILLLVALQDHKVRIELGAGYGAKHEQTASSIINNAMLPLCKQNKVPAAIIAGCNAITTQILVPQPASPWVWYIIILILIIFGIIAFFSLREALRHDTSYGFTPKDTSRSWLYYSLFGVSRHNSNQNARSPYSGYRGSSFGGGRSSGGGASGRW
ncbi:TPM domain-containing protein [Candidatus Dependentiae bacterium]|nr:TPM domain-containing protein [Candidatus Dependentiae bacterium]